MKLLRGAGLAGELLVVMVVFQLAAQSGYLDTHTDSQEAFLSHGVFAVLLGLIVPWLARPTSVAPSVRGAILRSVVAAVLLAVANAAVIASVRYHVAIDYISWGPAAALTGALVGLAAGPLVLVEAGAAREAPGRRGDLEAGFAAFLGAFFLLMLAAIEVRYAWALSQAGTIPETLEATGKFVDGCVEQPLQVFYRTAPYAVPFALLALARRRQLDLVRQTEVVFMGTAAILIAWAIANGVFSGHIIPPSGIYVFFPLRRGAVLVTAGVLPLAARLAELVEAKLARDQ